MTERQRQQLAAFIREQPGLWLLMMYAAGFLGCTAAFDGFRLMGCEDPSRVQCYLLPLTFALPMWLGLWGWARRTASGPHAESRV